MSELKCQKKQLFASKIIKDKWNFHLWSSLILKVDKKKSLQPSQILMEVSRKKFKNTFLALLLFHLVSLFTKKSPVLHRAESDEENVGEIFVRKLVKFIRQIKKEFKFPKTMIFGKEEKKKFDEATECWICGGGFDPDDKKVRDHCHFTGFFRGAAHNNCNLQFRKPTFTPVFFHNLFGYDAHLFVKNLGEIEGDISCLPNNEEKYISFSKKILLGTRQEGDKIKKIWHEIRFP